MRNFKRNEIKNSSRNIILSIVIFLSLFVGLIFGINKFEKVRKEQNLIITEQAIRKAVIQCYANEGMYPAELAYLEEHYYLRIDYDTYYVVYNSIASNFMPDIAVFERLLGGARWYSVIKLGW